MDFELNERINQAFAVINELKTSVDRLEAEVNDLRGRVSELEWENTCQKDKYNNRHRSGPLD